jgi:hypothetical protein
MSPPDEESKSKVPRIRPEHLAGVPGLRESAKQALLERQPEIAIDALAIPDVGRTTIRHLLKLGVISDPTKLKGRGMTPEELEIYSVGKHPEWRR